MLLDALARTILFCRGPLVPTTADVTSAFAGPWHQVAWDVFHCRIGGKDCLTVERPTSVAGLAQEQEPEEQPQVTGDEIRDRVLVCLVYEANVARQLAVFDKYVIVAAAITGDRYPAAGPPTGKKDRVSAMSM